MATKRQSLQPHSVPQHHAQALTQMPWYSGKEFSRKAEGNNNPSRASYNSGFPLGLSHPRTIHLAPSQPLVLHGRS